RQVGEFGCASRKLPAGTLDDAVGVEQHGIIDAHVLGGGGEAEPAAQWPGTRRLEEPGSAGRDQQRWRMAGGAVLECPGVGVKAADAQGGRLRPLYMFAEIVYRREAFGDALTGQ